jgi:hypothetical protein
MVKLYEKCLMLGQKEKTAIITFFLGRFSSFFQPFHPMSSFANGSFLGPRIAPTLHGSQASLKCTRFLKWRDLKIIHGLFIPIIGKRKKTYGLGILQL